MQEIEFRDGRRAVPDHVADFLMQYETYRYSYDDAMRLMNEDFLKRRLDKAQDDLIRQHFARYPKS